jgi:hypothetical protein
MCIPVITTEAELQAAKMECEQIRQKIVSCQDRGEPVDMRDLGRGYELCGASTDYEQENRTPRPREDPESAPSYMRGGLPVGEISRQITIGHRAAQEDRPLDLPSDGIAF